MRCEFREWVVLQGQLEVMIWRQTLRERDVSCHGGYDMRDPEREQDALVLGGRYVGEEQSGHDFSWRERWRVVCGETGRARGRGTRVVSRVDGGEASEGRGNWRSRVLSLHY